MSLTVFTEEGLKPSVFNANNGKIISFSILNKIRQTLDRTDVNSGGQDDIFTEAYIDEGGRNNSVTGTGTTALFDGVNKYVAAVEEGSGDTLHTNGATWSNTGNMFDGDNSTTPSEDVIGADSPTTTGIGTTFGAKTVVQVRVRVAFSDSDGASTKLVELQTFDGAIWTTVSTLHNSTATLPATNFFVSIASSVQGVRVQFTNSGAGTTPAFIAEVFRLDYYSAAATALIEHAIPTGTFNGTVSKNVGKVLFNVGDWESGVTVEHKLENASESSGFVADAALLSFSAFTSEPTKYIVRLIPKVSSPTIGFPSVRGAGVYTE